MEELCGTSHASDMQCLAVYANRKSQCQRMQTTTSHYSPSYFVVAAIIYNSLCSRIIKALTITKLRFQTTNRIIHLTSYQYYNETLLRTIETMTFSIIIRADTTTIAMCHSAHCPHCKGNIAVYINVVEL